MESKSPTKDIIIPKSQIITDSSYVCRNGYHLVKVYKTKWWCWNSDGANKQSSWPWNVIRKFLRVRKLNRTLTIDRLFFGATVDIMTALVFHVV